MKRDEYISPDVYNSLLPKQNPTAPKSAEPTTALKPASGVMGAANEVTNTVNKVMANGGAPIYNSQYGDQINTMLDGLLNQKEFSYDPQNDDTYNAYKNTYQREGRRAMEDTMGEFSALTGGMPSTAATIAGQQQNTLYASKLADKIPELKQLAYNMYQDKIANQRANLSALAQAERDQYGMYRDNVGDFQTNRQFGYNAERDKVGDQQWMDTFDYNKQRAGVADQQWMDSFNYNKGRDTVADQQWDKNFNYNKERAGVADQQWLDNYNYGAQRDKVGDQQWADTFNYGKERDAVGDQQWMDTFNNNNAQWRETFEYNKQNDSANRQASKTKSSSSKAPAKTVDNLMADMYNSPDPYLYLQANYNDYGIDKGQIKDVATYYSNTVKEAQFDPTVPTTQEMFQIVDELMAEGQTEQQALDTLYKSENVDDQTWANFMSMYNRSKTK